MPVRTIEDMEWVEPDITINGVELSFAQCMTLRIALTAFIFTMQEDHPNNTKLRQIYMKHVDAISKIMAK